jgi:hypothetical protein
MVKKAPGFRVVVVVCGTLTMMMMMMPSFVSLSSKSEVCGDDDGILIRWCDAASKDSRFADDNFAGFVVVRHFGKEREGKKRVNWKLCTSI